MLILLVTKTLIHITEFGYNFQLLFTFVLDFTPLLLLQVPYILFATSVAAA